MSRGRAVATDMLGILVAEERLRGAGLSEARARLHAGWLAEAAGGPSEALPEAGGGVDLFALSPPALHAHAILTGRLAAMRGTEGLIAAWITAYEVLGSSAAGRLYLAELARPSRLGGERLERALERVLRAGVAGALSLARSGTGDTARAAMAVLRRRAEGDGKDSPVGMAARAAVHEVTREACADLDQRAQELEVTTDLEPALELFERAARVDEVLGGDPGYRRRVLGALLPAAWRHYTARNWDALRALLALVTRASDGLATELEAEPGELAYRASVAQLLVFRSEMASTLERQIALAERALALCPTHHNARVVLSSQLTARAAHIRLREPARAREDLLRALELDPHNRRARSLIAPT